MNAPFYFLFTIKKKRKKNIPAVFCKIPENQMSIKPGVSLRQISCSCLPSLVSLTVLILLGLHGNHAIHYCKVPLLFLSSPSVQRPLPVSSLTSGFRKDECQAADVNSRTHLRLVEIKSVCRRLIS